MRSALRMRSEFSHAKTFSFVSVDPKWNPPARTSLHPQATSASSVSAKSFGAKRAAW